MSAPVRIKQIEWKRSEFATEDSLFRLLTSLDFRSI